MNDYSIDISHAPITQIREYAFAGLDVVSVDLPHTLVKLPRYAFYNCYLLETIVIPFTLTEIPDYCFWGCSVLSSIVINGVDLFLEKTLDFTGSGIRTFQPFCFFRYSNLFKNYF